ncbi:hypothetical protein [Gaiella sp.]|uniref:hypothetical protein n=1 Tax=Gaiella sp. TaxID=2663207 RepID=UPI003262E554
MAKYALLYRGGGGMPETPEEGKKIMAAWMTWYGALGEAVSDGGAPFGPSLSISADGGRAPNAPSGLSGYTILTADNLEAATEMASGCPVLAGGGAVDVYERIDMEM